MVGRGQGVCRSLRGIPESELACIGTGGRASGRPLRCGRRCCGYGEIKGKFRLPYVPLGTWFSPFDTGQTHLIRALSPRAPSWPAHNASNCIDITFASLQLRRPRRCRPTFLVAPGLTNSYLHVFLARFRCVCTAFDTRKKIIIIANVMMPVRDSDHRRLGPAA